MERVVCHRCREVVFIRGRYGEVVLFGTGVGRLFC